MTKKILAWKKESELHGGRQQIQCSICGENDRNKIQVECLGIAAGVSGDDYSFCSSCWNSNGLGMNILKLLDYPFGLKLLDESVEIKEVEHD